MNSQTITVFFWVPLRKLYEPEDKKETASNQICKTHSLVICIFSATITDGINICYPRPVASQSVKSPALRMISQPESGSK